MLRKDVETWQKVKIWLVFFKELPRNCFVKKDVKLGRKKSADLSSKYGQGRFMLGFYREKLWTI